ncbi:hypothetical protein [Aporhodopirellula aestuarii]|uniref:Uncharacterized protein n=1 Tax=Aporhodopirellula aestuarii TaxID=2950107 RepID=A0ABT0U5B0_9BACT|nr:hypothetical protein [Aporhodopirellula aestuarii]MCM2372093.1 hypothetical protein [Aporhodopirellula aestuarii]
MLQIPENLVADYVQELHGIGRYEDACKKLTSSSTGGADRERTHNAFVDRFCASVCRSGYLVLDNKERLKPVSNELLARLGDGRLAILDVPCGSGAGLLGLLSLIASLRVHGSLPRLPLTIDVTAGDFSATARSLYHNMLLRAVPWLEEQGVRIRWTTHAWDAADQFSTSAIVDQWLNNSPDCEDFVVLVSAFSDAAANNFSKFERSFQHITERIHNRSSAFVWIEPDWKKSWRFFDAIEPFFDKLLNLFRGTKRLSDNFRWHHPLNENDCDGKILVVRHESLRGAS